MLLEPVHHRRRRELWEVQRWWGGRRGGGAGGGGGDQGGGRHWNLKWSLWLQCWSMVMVIFIQCGFMKERSGNEGDTWNGNCERLMMAFMLWPRRLSICQKHQKSWKIIRPAAEQVEEKELPALQKIGFSLYSWLDFSPSFWKMFESVIKLNNFGSCMKNLLLSYIIIT